jgi:hypothetical protein
MYPFGDHLVQFVLVGVAYPEDEGVVVAESLGLFLVVQAGFVPVDDDALEEDR